MLVKFAILCFWIFFGELLGSEGGIVVIGVGLNEIIQVPKLKRAAIANAKIAKLKAVPPRQVLVTGKKVGETMVRVWRKGGEMSVYEIRVLPLHLYDQYLGRESHPVVRVFLEFLELDKTRSQTLGIRWPDSLQFSGGGGIHGTGSTSGLNYTFSFGTAQGLLEALIREGTARVLARPELHVRMGEEAIFHSGGEFPVPTKAGTYRKHRSHVDWKTHGLTVRVRPESIDNLNIQSDVEVEISEPNWGNEIGGIPGLTKRKLQTKITAINNQPVILSGLIRRVAASSSQGIPILSSIPLLGSLFFRSERESREDSEILMAMTFQLNHHQEGKKRWHQFQKTIREGF